MCLSRYRQKRESRFEGRRRGSTSEARESRRATRKTVSVLGVEGGGAVDPRLHSQSPQLPLWLKSLKVLTKSHNPRSLLPWGCWMTAASLLERAGRTGGKCQTGSKTVHINYAKSVPLSLVPCAAWESPVPSQERGRPVILALSLWYTGQSTH